MQAAVLALTFLAVYQMSNRIRIPPVFGASIVIATPFVLTLLLRFIYSSGSLNILRWSDLLILLFQFVAYLFIFYRSQHEESISSWIGWGVSGLLIVPILSACLEAWLMFI
ncbi:hypothetical protein D3C85_861700 [compost metagenome]